MNTIVISLEIRDLVNEYYAAETRRQRYRAFKRYRKRMYEKRKAERARGVTPFRGLSQYITQSESDTSQPLTIETLVGIMRELEQR